MKKRSLEMKSFADMEASKEGFFMFFFSIDSLISHENYVKYI